MLSPKTRFQQSPDASLHFELVRQPGFQHALEAALTEMQLTMPTSADVSANWYRLQGAKEYIRILLTLADPVQQRKRPAGENLAEL